MISKNNLNPHPLVLDTADDEALVKQVQQNLRGQTAFAELYRRHVTRVYRYLLARVNNVQDAQDLTAQTFLAALESMPNYRHQSKFSTWLLGIARHRCADYFRRHRPTAPIESAEQLWDGAIRPDESIEQQLQLEAVMHGMRVLSPDRAEALALHSFSGLTVPEVAQVMKRSEAAVRMLIHRAIQDLQQRLRVPLQEQTA